MPVSTAPGTTTNVRRCITVFRYSGDLPFTKSMRASGILWLLSSPQNEGLDGLCACVRRDGMRLIEPFADAGDRIGVERAVEILADIAEVWCGEYIV
jgi:hypothetical protein